MMIGVALLINAVGQLLKMWCAVSRRVNTLHYTRVHWTRMDHLRKLRSDAGMIADQDEIYSLVSSK